MCYNLNMKNLSILRKNILFLVVAIFLINFLAMRFHWYSAVWWFDMPMHFAGGVFIFLLTFYLLSKYEKQEIFKDNLIKKLALSLISVLIIGILWEFFEQIVSLSILERPIILLDSLSDMCFDMAGGSFIGLYLFRVKSSG